MDQPDLPDLTPEIVSSVEWLQLTALGHVALRVTLLGDDVAPTQEVMARWTARLEHAVREVLGDGLTNARLQAQALLGKLMDATVGAPLLEWPAVLVLRPAGRTDELQHRVQAYLFPED